MFATYTVLRSGESAIVNGMWPVDTDERIVSLTVSIRTRRSFA